MVCKDKARSFWVRYINERVLASFADHMSTITSTQAEPVASTEAEGMHAVAQTSNAILARLKEVRTVHLNATKHNHIFFLMGEWGL
jgi:hypothetical protein